VTATALRIQIQESLGNRFDKSLGIREKPAFDVVPTGISGIDIPRGTLTEICGPASSGRTSVVTAALARATRRPEFCALIDASNSFDPETAAEAGVYLPYLLWLRCRSNAEQALKVTDLVVQGGGFGMIVLDLAGVSIRDTRRISLATWFRLRHAVEKTPTALVVVGDELQARSCSTLQIENRQAGFHVNGKLLRNIAAEAAIGPRSRAKAAMTLHSHYEV
jgi:hypothetical protein